jgi:hypothetical protein
MVSTTLFENNTVAAPETPPVIIFSLCVLPLGVLLVMQWLFTITKALTQFVPDVLIAAQTLPWFSSQVLFMK